MHKKLFIIVNVDWFFLSHRKDIALAAQKAGYDVTIVTADTGKLQEISQLGLKVINLPMNRSGMNIMEELKTLRFLIRLYKKEKPDIVHHVGMKTILWGSIAAKITHIHGVVNAISGLGGLFAQDHKSITSKIIPFVLRWSHKRDNLLCIFQNDDDWNMYVTHGIIRHEQGRYIKGSGIDLKQFAYTPEPKEGKLKVILTARMIVEKGIFLLIEAAERLRSKYEDNAIFQLIGGLDDHPDAITEEQLKQVCDGTYIEWLGYRTDVLELLKQCHIVAFPSYYMEGLPKSLIEANAVGRPIITSNSVGCKETVVDGYNGFLITPKDIDALTEKLDLLLSNPILREEMGKNARHYAEEYFSIEEVVNKHLSIYQELII